MEQPFPGSSPGKSDWRDRLADTEYFTGAEKDIVWNKLQARLPQRRKKSRFVYLAAACIALLAVPASIIYFTNDNTPVVSVKPGNTPEPSKSTSLQPGANHQAGMKAELPAVKDQSVQFTNEMSKTIVLANQTIQPADSVTIHRINQSIDQTTQPNVAAVNEEPVNEIASVAAVPTATSPKPALKVVHVNDLDAPAPNAYRRVNASDFSFIQFSISPQQHYQSSSPVKIGVSFSTGKGAPSN